MSSSTRRFEVQHICNQVVLVLVLRLLKYGNQPRVSDRPRAQSSRQKLLMALAHWFGRALFPTARANAGLSSGKNVSAPYHSPEDVLRAVQQPDEAYGSQGSSENGTTSASDAGPSRVAPKIDAGTPSSSSTDFLSSGGDTLQRGSSAAQQLIQLSSTGSDSRSSDNVDEPSASSELNDVEIRDRINERLAEPEASPAPLLDAHASELDRSVKVTMDSDEECRCCADRQCECHDEAFLPRTPTAKKADWAIEHEFDMCWILEPAWSLRKPKRRTYWPKADAEFFEPDESETETVDSLTEQSAPLEKIDVQAAAEGLDISPTGSIEGSVGYASEGSFTDAQQLAAAAVAAAAAPSTAAAADVTQAMEERSSARPVAPKLMARLLQALGAVCSCLCNDCA
ncbi:usp33 [Symbiodinium sp. CCMP2456]|nr:usp33 [Symbiodinium sp. CCMP2456]